MLTIADPCLVCAIWTRQNMQVKIIIVYSVISFFWYFFEKKSELIFLYYVNWNIKYRRVYLFSFHVECIRYIFTIIQLRWVAFLHILKKQFSCYANRCFFCQGMSNLSRQLRNKTKTDFLCIISKQTIYVTKVSIICRKFTEVKS